MSKKSQREHFINSSVREKGISYKEAKEEAKKIFGESKNPHKINLTSKATSKSAIKEFHKKRKLEKKLLKTKNDHS